MAISAEAVRDLRQQTGLPLMDCKKALTECDGDAEKAKVWLRERGAKVLEKRSDRETSFGRFGIYGAVDGSTGAMVELQCESAPVTNNEEFIQLCNDLAQAMATTDASNAEELLAKPSPSKDGMTLAEQKDELFNRIREVFNVGRVQRFEGGCGGYSHNAGTVSGVLVQVEGGTDEAARDISMHIAAMRPAALSIEDLNQEDVDRERGILREAALQEGKPESIVDKMVEGRMRNYFAERALLEQNYVKDDSMTVGKYAESVGMTIKQFVHWELGG